MINERIGVTAKKRHNCALCGEPINAGEKYNRRVGTVDGDFFSMAMHPECYAKEQIPGSVDSDWYEDCSDPAFSRPNKDRALREQLEQT